MKRSLILFWHGLGDIILLTAHLRHLYKKGYRTDLMCLPETRKSRMLDHCPYIGKLIDLDNPWRKDARQTAGLRTNAEFHRYVTLNISKFNDLRGSYDWSGMSPHHMAKYRGLHKMDMTSAELKLELNDRKTEVFIPESAEQEALKYTNGDYIFVHTTPEFHAYHNWDATKWMEDNLPPLRIINTGFGAEYFMAFNDINTAFVILREAKHRVLSSSIFVYACIAMGHTIDALNYGRADRHMWPVDMTKVLRLREMGKWIK